MTRLSPVFLISLVSPYTNQQKSREGDCFEVPIKVACLSGIIDPPLISPRIEDLVQKWYAEFVSLPQKQLFELVEAANYLDIKPLLNLTVYAIAILLKVCCFTCIGHPVGELSACSWSRWTTNIFVVNRENPRRSFVKSLLTLAT